MSLRTRGFVSLLALLIIAIIVGGGAYVYVQQDPKSTPPSSNELLPTQTPNDEYPSPKEASMIIPLPAPSVRILTTSEQKLNDLKVGDVWGDFVVAPSTPGGPSHVNFVGTTTVSGTFGELEGMLEGSFCFNVDPVDAHKIPRLKGDDRNPWFCFSNDSEAKKALSSVSGKVTVRIANYWLLTAHIGGADGADFVSLAQ